MKIEQRRGGDQGSAQDQGLGQNSWQHENSQADEHANGGETEAVVPAIGLPDKPAKQRRHRGAEVDSYIEEGKARISLGAPLGVERTDDG